MNIDNLSEKFYPVSPYIYAINNPVYFIDPDGNEIKIGENIYSYKKDRDYNDYAEGFERDAYMALDNLYSSGAMNVTFGEGDNAKTVNVLDEMINSTDYTVSIEEGTNKNPHNFLHNKDNNTSAKILFRGDIGSGFLKDANGKWEESNFGYNSPAGNLAHEIMHGFSKFNDKDFQSRWDDKSTQGQILFTDSQGSEDLSFPNREEQYNTTMTNQVLTKLGEDTRTNYGANPVSTQGVNSNKPRR